MQEKVQFTSILKNIITNRIYLGILFGSISAIVILGILYFKFIAPSFYAQMMTNVTDEAKRIGTHIKWHQSENISLKQLEKLRRDFGLYKIRIFNEEGKIIMSTKTSEIGNLTTYKYFKTELPKGDIYYKVDKKITIDSKTSKEKEIDVAEIYVPIMFDNVFAGASEVYFNITSQKEDFEELLEKTTNILFFAISIFLSVLFVVLYFSSKNNLIQKSKEVMMFEQSKLASLGEMIGNIAHQWRQPLSMITSSITTLKVKKEMGIMDDEDFNSTVDKIVNSTEYLSNTIDDFRNFFNNDKDKLIVDTKNLIDSTINIISDNLKNNTIEVITNIQNTEVELLENELKQVLINIINNSKDALIAEKNSNLEERYIFIDAIKQNDKFIITIKDNAGGIPNDIISKIFEPYFTTKHKSIGTGIGLYMCKSIIENNMNGKIEVKNTSFTYNNKNYNGAVFTVAI